MASIVQATGVPGVAPCYTHLAGHDLPEPQKAQLLVIIDLFRTLGADQWTASYVCCRRQHAATYKITLSDESEGTITLTDAVMISLAVKIGYGEERITHALEDAESIALYDTLVSAEFWVKYLDAKQAENTTESGQ